MQDFVQVYEIYTKSELDWIKMYATEKEESKLKWLKEGIVLCFFFVAFF